MKLPHSFIALVAVVCFSAEAFAGDPTSRDAGFSLLQNFQCDNKGTVTQRVVDSISRTKAVIAQIGETEKECAGLAQQISQLPDINAISSSIRANATVNAIRLQEGTVNEALADMAYVSQLPQDDPQRALYPDAATLASTVQQARVQLINLRAQLSIDQTNQSKTNMINGISQMDSIAQGYASALKGGEACFKKRPDLRQHLFTGIIGIAGFFLTGPLGIATALAGRLFQNIFDINAAGKNRIRESFSAADQTAITLGLGCAFEQLGTQHCRILREKKLFTAINDSNAKACSAVAGVQEVINQQRNLLEALKKIEDFSSKIAVVSQDPLSAGVREAAKSTYSATISSMRQGVLNASSNAKGTGATFNGDALQSGLMSVFQSYGQMINPKFYGSNSGMGMSSAGGGSSAGAAASIQSSFTSAEQKNDMINLILKPGENPETIFSSLKDEFLKAQKDNSQGGSQSFLNSSQLNSAYQMFSYLASLPDERQGDMTKNLVARLKDKETSQIVLAHINDVEKTLSSSLASDLSPEQTLSYINEYFQGQDVLDLASSPNEALKLLDKQLQEMKKNPKMNAERSGLTKLADAVHQVVESAKIQDGQPQGAASQKKFIGELNALVGRNREFYTQLKTVMNFQLGIEGRDLIKASNEGKNEGVAMQAMFLLNQETLNNTIGFSRNPSAKISEYDGAVALSAAQIDGFSRFSEPYLDYAIKYMNGKDAHGSALPSGILQNMSPDIKNRFCVQALSLTQIPSSLLELCKGAKITSGELKVEFDHFAGLGQQERSCAYYNFATQEQAASEVKLGR